MKRLILLTIAICFAKSSYSQTDYRNGFVITSARDTLFGLVNYREGAKAYTSCNFKNLKDQNEVSYEPKDIIGYGFENDKFFCSRTISIKDQQSKVVFLEVIVKGTVSLYRFEESFFCEKHESGLHPLSNITTEEFVNGNRVLKTTNQYIGILNWLLSDCADIRPKVQKVRVTEKALANLIEDYNRCKGETSITYKTKKPWVKTMVGLSGGLNISKPSFDVQPGYGHVHLESDFDVSLSPTIGVSVDAFFPRLSERTSFHGDIFYLASKYYDYNYKFFNAGSVKVTSQVTIELQQIKIPMGLRHTFPKRNFTSYFDIGVSGSVHLNSSSNLIKKTETSTASETYEGDALAIKNGQFGLWGGFGLVKSISRKLDAFAELRYERTDGIDRSIGLTSKISNFQMLIGIRLK